MLKPSKYQLFISNKCSCCDKILTLLEKERISIPTINIDNEDYHLPFHLSILPALVEGEKLICYGADDIISRVRNH